MKTERRHELETNQLADSLGHWADAIRPYANSILVGILALVVAAAVYRAQRRTAAETAAAWDEYFAAIIVLRPAQIGRPGRSPRRHSGRLVVAVHGRRFGAGRGEQPAFPRQRCWPAIFCDRQPIIISKFWAKPAIRPCSSRLRSVWRAFTNAWARSRRPKPNIKQSPPTGPTLLSPWPPTSARRT